MLPATDQRESDEYLLYAEVGFTGEEPGEVAVLIGGMR